MLAEHVAQTPCECLSDGAVGIERHMRAVLLAAADRHERQPSPARKPSRASGHDSRASSNAGTGDLGGDLLGGPASAAPVFGRLFDGKARGRRAKPDRSDQPARAVTTATQRPTLSFSRSLTA